MRVQLIPYQGVQEARRVLSLLFENQDSEESGILSMCCAADEPSLLPPINVRNMMQLALLEKPPVC